MSSPSIAMAPDAPVSCESEAIQFTGAIQPNGFLLSVDGKWTVVRASQNVEAFLGKALDSVIGVPVRNLIHRELLHDIRGCLQSAGGVGIVGRLFGRPIVPDGAPFDIAAHRSGREFILEFEPAVGRPGGSLSDLKAMISSVERQGSPKSLLTMTARHMRAFTGFDRVMIYRFDEDGAGEVAAESVQGNLDSYVGLRYPASDIPAQARLLYERSYLRSISDVDAVPVQVSSARSVIGDALDLSMSALRSVSPTHVEYLKNMGVGASMSVSILRGGRLWGLIACHHRVPRHIGYELRSAIELFGQMFSYLLEEHEREDNTIFDTSLQDVRDRIAADFVGPRAVLDRLPQLMATIAELIPCDGVAVSAAGEVTLAGHTPNRSEVLDLVRFLDEEKRTTFATHAISTSFPRAIAHAQQCSGLLALTVSTKPCSSIILFRREVTRTVVWAGEPKKAVVASSDGLRLSPRLSFQAWRETVRGQSSRWTERDLHAANGLRSTLIELALQASDGAHVERTKDSQRQEILIAELNHRVRNILGLVRGLISESAASAKDVRALVDSLDDRIRSLASANDILTKGNFQPSSLHALLHAEISTYSQLEGALVLTGPDVMLEPHAYTTMAMVVHELVTNARKYGALTSIAGQVVVETTTAETGDISISWRETGGPPVSQPTRRGFGSTIFEHAIPFECHGTSGVSYHPNGFRLSLTIPAELAVSVDGSLARTTETEHYSFRAATLSGILQDTLVVEDNLFIAFDAEDMLYTLGAGSIEVVKSVAEALSAIAQRRFSFALLDVNLGAQSSLPVALALREARIPFVFGTGYNQGPGMPASLADVIVVSKPYNRYAMRAALTHLLANRAFAADMLVGLTIPQMHQPLPPVLVTKKAKAFYTTDKLTGQDGNIIAADQDIKQRQALCFVGKLDRLAALTQADKLALVELTVPARTITRKTDIVQEGSRSNGLHVVLIGFACRFRLRADGSRQITSYLIPGDVCDLSDIHGDMTDSLGTLSNCRIASISREAAVELTADRSQVAAALLRSAYVERAVCRKWLANLGRRSPEERFAHLFCELLVRLQDVGLVKRDGFTMPLTQFDLGDSVGLSYVHVNRTLQSLRRRGLISLKGKLLSILDLPSLITLAEFDPGYLRFA